MRRAKRERGDVSMCEGMGAGGAREARRRGGRVRAGQPLRGDITRRRKTRSTENLDRRRWNAEGRGAEAVSSRTWNGLGSARSSKGLSAMVASVSRVYGERGLECTTEPPKVASLSRSQTAPPTNITRSVWAVSLRSRINQATVWGSPDFLHEPFEKFWKVNLTTLRDRPLPRARAHDGGRYHARRGTRGESRPIKPARPAFPDADSLIAPVPKPPQPPPISFFSRRLRGTPRPLQRRERRQSASRAGEPNRRERFRRLSSTPSTVERGRRAFS